MCQTYFGWTVRLKFTDEKSDQYYFMEFLFNEKEYQFYPFRYECFDHKIGDTEKDIKIDAEDYDNQNCEIGERFPKSKLENFYLSVHKHYKYLDVEFMNYVTIKGIDYFNK